MEYAHRFGHQPQCWERALEGRGQQGLSTLKGPEQPPQQSMMWPQCHEAKAAKPWSGLCCVSHTDLLTAPMPQATSSDSCADLPGAALDVLSADTCPRKGGPHMQGVTSVQPAGVTRPHLTVAWLSCRSQGVRKEHGCGQLGLWWSQAPEWVCTYCRCLLAGSNCLLPSLGEGQGGHLHEAGPGLCRAASGAGALSSGGQGLEAPAEGLQSPGPEELPQVRDASRQPRDKDSFS